MEGLEVGREEAEIIETMINKAIAQMTPPESPKVPAIIRANSIQELERHNKV
jgi:hypothetical protein